MLINNVLDRYLHGMPRGSGSTEQDYAVLYAVTRGMQAEKILEIGTNKGFSAVVLCQAVIDNGKIPTLWTVDNWVVGNPVMAKQLFEETGFDGYVKMITGDSKSILPILFNDIGEVDLIFIDGNHSIEAVSCDRNNCQNYTDCLIFHDTGFGDYVYLKELINEWDILSIPTRYVEGNGHLVGITIAVRKGRKK